MVVGMPNVGKSSIINKLIKKTKAKTGAKAGVTRDQQWVRINPKVDLLDTPGIIPLKQEDRDKDPPAYLRSWKFLRKRHPFPVPFLLPEK